MEEHQASKGTNTQTQDQNLDLELHKLRVLRASLESVRQLTDAIANDIDTTCSNYLTIQDYTQELSRLNKQLSNALQ